MLDRLDAQDYAKEADNFAKKAGALAPIVCNVWAAAVGGDRSITIGRDITGSAIVSGDNNVVVVLPGVRELSAAPIAALKSGAIRPRDLEGRCRCPPWCWRSPSRARAVSAGASGRAGQVPRMGADDGDAVGGRCRVTRSQPNERHGVIFDWSREAVRVGHNEAFDEGRQSVIRVRHRATNRRS